MYSVIPIVQGSGVIKGDGAVLPQEGRYHAKPVFSFFEISKILQDFPSHQIFGHMHGALNVGKKITNCTVCL
jgi:hypothetical protein